MEQKNNSFSMCFFHHSSVHGIAGSGSSAAQWNSGWCPTSTVPLTEQEWDLWHNWVVVADIVYCHPEIWGKWSNLTSTFCSDGLVQPATRKRMVQRSRKLVWKNLYIYIYEPVLIRIAESSESHWNSGAFSGWLLGPSFRGGGRCRWGVSPPTFVKGESFGVFIWGQKRNRHHKSTLESENTKVKTPKSMGRGWGACGSYRRMVINESTQQHSQLHIIYIYMSGTKDYQ